MERFMIIKSPPAPLFQRGESTQKSLMRHYYMLGVPIKKPDAPERVIHLCSRNNALFAKRDCHIHTHSLTLRETLSTQNTMKVLQAVRSCFVSHRLKLIPCGEQLDDLSGVFLFFIQDCFACFTMSIALRCPNPSWV